MKKLDKLILKSFLGPFIITFFIALFVLIMQTVWKYIDDLVGKGLDFLTIGEFLWYTSATLLTLAMPIAILISSIMTFGNLGESFELVAIKSSGVSLLRFMRPLMWVAILLSGITFLFANYVIPYANLKSVTLYNDILYKRPAFDLKEGQFFTAIPGYAIRTSKKDADGKTIHNVVIYDQTNYLQDNTIVAESGVMKISDDKRYLEFYLANGYRYQEKQNPGDTAAEYVRLGFKTFKKLFDISVLQKTNTSDSLYRKNFKMLSVRQLDISMDSIRRITDSLYTKIDKDQKNYTHYTQLPDSTWKKVAMPQVKQGADFTSLLPDSARSQVYEIALGNAGMLRSEYEFTGAAITADEKDLRYHAIEWHRKFSLSMACIVLFFIGAPLGSIIRKGGLGMPLVVAIVFFLIFHLLNMFGEKFVKEDLTSPFTGMWLAVMILVPVGIFLTYKAMHDSQLFSKEFYYRTFKALRPFFSKFRRAKKNGETGTA